MTAEPTVPFSIGDWLIDRQNPGQPGQFTGGVWKAGPFLMVELRYPDGSTNRRPRDVLEKMERAQEGLLGRMLKGHFGRARDLRRVITYEKLKGTLHEVVYSMEAAQIDFYPYQFKPVMKIINAPTERLILADEVGLGKTIESALIWLELKARRQAKRLLVVCPNILADKWENELRRKFMLDARVVKFPDLQKEVDEFRQSGPSHEFVLIGTYTGLRPPRDELRLLDDPPGTGEQGSPKTEFLRGLRHGDWEHEPFDMVVFDEAHYMRNPATTTFHLGEALSDCAGAVLCVSATPINNSNVDLHSLLRLIDESFFESQGMFEQLLNVNRPAVRAGSALERHPVDIELLARLVQEMSHSPFIQNSPQYKRFVEATKRLDPTDKAAVAKCQGMAESLNLLGQYVNRTRRVQVKEHRPVRDPYALEVEYSPEEMKLYNAILHLVRERCKRDSRPFHVFQVLGFQLRAASCLPAVAQEIREGRFGDVIELMEEAVGAEAYDDLFDDIVEDTIGADELQQLLNYDFAANDSKYRELRRMLTEQITQEKVLIFAYYRPTLSYLFRRLTEDGISVTMIHGGVPTDDRWRELDRFRDPRGPRVLLSSEVGSEGIDLEFCRVLVNYDLPWNPMRVEQRIGRIDRIGQKADRLAIVNFKVHGTVEEWLYTCLHEKLLRIADSLGDMEAIIGQKVRELTVELLSKDLTPEQQAERVASTAAALERQALQIGELERSGDALIALSDYLQRRIEETRGRGRYMQAEELEDYVIDFFEREFPGCELYQNTPTDGCMNIRLTPDAQAALSAYIHNDRSLSARLFRQKEFTISFRRETMQRLTPQQLRTVSFTNHLSPLVRWITKTNRDRGHAMYNVSASTLSGSALPPGTYLYRIERWMMKGLSAREQLAYAVVPLESMEPFGEGASEELVQLLLRTGTDWVRVSCDPQRVQQAYERAEADLNARFDAAVTDFNIQNATARQIREQRVKGFFDRRIKQAEAALQTSRLKGSSARDLKRFEGLLRSNQENKEQKLKELDLKAGIDVESAPVAAGIFLVA